MNTDERRPGQGNRTRTVWWTQFFTEKISLFIRVHPCSSVFKKHSQPAQIQMLIGRTQTWTQNHTGFRGFSIAKNGARAILTEMKICFLALALLGFSALVQAQPAN